MNNMIKGTVQVAALMAFSLLMNKLAGLLHLPIPGSILGIVVVFVLLETEASSAWNGSSSAPIGCLRSCFCSSFPRLSAS